MPCTFLHSPLAFSGAGLYSIPLDRNGLCNIEDLLSITNADQQLAHLTQTLSLKPLHCSAQQALPTQIFVQVYRGHSPRSRGHPQARLSPCPSPLATPSPPLSFRRNKNKASGTLQPGQSRPWSHSLTLSRQVRGKRVLGGSLGDLPGDPTTQLGWTEAPTQPPGRSVPGLRLSPAPPGRSLSPARPLPAARTPALKRFRGPRWPKRLRG